MGGRVCIVLVLVLTLSLTPSLPSDQVKAPLHEWRTCYLDKEGVTRPSSFSASMLCERRAGDSDGDFTPDNSYGHNQVLK